MVGNRRSRRRRRREGSRMMTIMVMVGKMKRRETGKISPNTGLKR